MANHRKYPLDTPYDERVKYSRAKAQAKYRREEWAFTFETWYNMWLESGVIEHRGSRPHHYCMVRLDTIEAWGPHNCIIVSRRTHMKKAHHRMTTGQDTDWQRRHGVGK